MTFVARQGWVTPALLVLNGTLIAAIYACAKIAGANGVPAFSVLSWQVGFAAIVVAAVVAVRGELPRPTYVNLRYAAIAGVLGITGPNFVTFTALAHLPSSVIGVITSLSPLFTYAIALLLRIERLDALRAAGIVTGLLGVVLIVMPGSALPAIAALPWAVLAIAAPLLLAGGNVFRSVAWPSGLQPMAAAALLLALQSLLLVPAALIRGQLAVPGTLWRAEDFALLGAGILTAVFYLSAFELQRRGGPVVVSQLGYVITVASILIGLLVFGERPSPGSIAAVVVVLLGVALVNRQPRAQILASGAEKYFQAPRSPSA